jgi:ubiquinone/menaquinone biosynthesis C-methylase UbiE
VTVRQPPTGPNWGSLAGLDPLAAVLDPGDSIGTKNAFIDRIHKSAVLRALGPLQGRAVLDFGCGTGRLTRFVADHGAKAVGVDATREMIESARSLSPELRYEQIDGRSLPFDDDAFDVVMTAYVLQYYVSGNGLDELVDEFARVLRAGGTLIAIEQVASSLDRGADLASYTAELARPPFSRPSARPIRPGVSSRVLDAISYHRLLRSAPFVSTVAALEARRACRRGLRPGEYVDTLFETRRS